MENQETRGLLLCKITHHNSIELSVLVPSHYTLLYRLDHIFRFSGDSNMNKKELTDYSGEQNTIFPNGNP